MNRTIIHDYLREIESYNRMARDATKALEGRFRESETVSSVLKKLINEYKNEAQRRVEVLRSAGVAVL